MTLDEAIKHAEEVAEENEKFCYKKGGEGGYFNEDTDWNNIKCAEEHRQLADWLKELKKYKDQDSSTGSSTDGDCISRQAAIDAFHTWFRDGFDEDKWWNSTHVLAAIEGIPSVHQKHKWETCFECPLSHGCPKIKGCTNEQAIEYASKIPNDCPLSAQPERKTDGDTISRQAVIELAKKGVLISNGNYESVCKAINEIPAVDPQNCDQCEVGNPCLYCKHEFDPQERRDKE